MPLPKRVSPAARLSSVLSRVRHIAASSRPRLVIACGIEVADTATPGMALTPFTFESSGGGVWLSEFSCHSIWENAPSL